MNYELLIDTAALAGEIMLYSGAETYRVEDTMRHILNTSESKDIESLVLMTGLMVSLGGKNLKRITAIKRVKHTGTNLGNVVQVNDISRRFCNDEIKLEEAYKELMDIKKNHYSELIYSIATIVAVVGFSLMFGGGFYEFGVAIVVGTLLAIILKGAKKIGINIFIRDCFASICITCVTILCKAYLVHQVDVDIVIIGAIMPLVPGVAITNAVRDTLQGDYISGVARVLEAFLVASAIALGVGIGMALLSNMITWGGIVA
ncbi:MAG: threonine/serine exporter family protein [Lachnospiraceae bacterium]